VINDVVCRYNGILTAQHEEAIMVDILKHCRVQDLGEMNCTLPELLHVNITLYSPHAESFEISNFVSNRKEV
jgi:hypothetical protein